MQRVIAKIVITVIKVGLVFLNQTLVGTFGFQFSATFIIRKYTFNCLMFCVVFITLYLTEHIELLFISLLTQGIVEGKRQN